MNRVLLDMLDMLTINYIWEKVNIFTPVLYVCRFISRILSKLTYDTSRFAN